MTCSVSTGLENNTRTVPAHTCAPLYDHTVFDHLSGEMGILLLHFI